ncbi:MAG: hypothetical protein HY707_02830 [Ignavibacteriae bacterium]|nr:hypothetical protein [Ignavibacteriota bacterium]
MKRLFIVFLFFAYVINLHAGEKKLIPRYNKITQQWALYPEVTIRDIQEVPLDSLLLLESLSNPHARWTLQTSPLEGDTVVITAIVITPFAGDPPYPGLTFTQSGWTMILHDTAVNSNEWGGILVRVGSGVTGAGPDTSQARLDGFTTPERGDVIKITGWVEEFPTTATERANSTTQFRPYPGISIDIVGSAPIPEPDFKPVSDFYVGAHPGGQVKYSTGEPYEGSLVVLYNLAVNAQLNTGRGTWVMNDDAGNYLADYDASHYFTFGHGTPPTDIPGDPSFVYPPVGAIIDTIRGTMLTVAGGENPRGYRICPLYPGDVVYGIALPTVIQHRRYPVVVTSQDTVRVNAIVRKTTGGYDIAEARLFTSINNGPWTDAAMTMISPDSTYEGIIWDVDHNPWPNGTNVRYFIKGIDTAGNEKILANSSSQLGGDSSKGLFFYTVRDGPLSIYDVQYTPYTNGRSAYVGGVVSVSGIVTADTSDLALSPFGPLPGGTNVWFIQSGNTPWSGIWVVSRDSATHAALSAMKRGDSVTVTGTVQEYTNSFNFLFENTRILDSLVTIHSSGHQVPEPVDLTTGTFGPTIGNGNPIAEPYEGMLVRLTNAVLADVYPYFSDPTEYSVDDGTGPILVLRDGLNSYSNQPGDTASNKLILHAGDRVDTLVGIIYGSYGRYKIDPRQNSDFVVGEPYQYRKSWNIISIGRDQLPATTGYNLSTLFPSAISQSFAYEGAYVVDTVLDHRKGYWIKFGNDQIIRQLGEKRTEDTVYVAAGWNLAGTIGDPALTSSITAYPPNNHLSQFFGYKGGYNVEDTLKPSEGYWVKSDSVGYFILSGLAAFPRIDEPSHAPQAMNTLTITDKEGNRQTLLFCQDEKGNIRLQDYEMPPLSPDAEKFSVQFTSGRVLETYPAHVKENLPYEINVRALQAPMTISWTIASKDRKKFSLHDDKNGKTIDLTNSGQIVYAKAGEFKLTLVVGAGSSIPKEFSLGQNYPNPFNPSTAFEVGLPYDSKLEVVVYNLLGQKAATLADEVRQAGYHMIEWDGKTSDGSQAATGVYFVRMMARPVTASADAFISVRKVMMLK